MNGSVLNSTVKVYPSKNNRTSRSYRSSYFAPQPHIFLDDDQEPDLFDKLVIDAKIKGQNQSSLVSSIDHSIQLPISKRNTCLRDVGNTDNALSADRNCFKKKTKTKKKDKENSRHQSLLYQDDDDFNPYIFNPHSDRKVRTKSCKRVGSTKVRESAKIDLREEKLRKAQELREKQQLERAQCRMSKVHSTPNKDTSSSNDLNPDVSYISKVAADPLFNRSPPSPSLSNFTSIRNNDVERSSEIFMSETSKPNIRKKLSFINTFREERKTLSPNDLELSCCDKDGHKSSGSSGARSLDSERSNYFTCVKIDEPHSSGDCEENCNTINGRRSRSLETTRVRYPEVPNEPEYNSRRRASQSLPRESYSIESVVADVIDSDDGNEDIEFGASDDSHDDKTASPSRSDSDNSKYDECDLKILNSVESESEIDELAIDIENIDLTRASGVEISYTDSNTSDNMCESNASERVSSDIFYESDLVSEDSQFSSSDESTNIGSIEQSRNPTVRSRMKSVNRFSLVNKSDYTSPDRVGSQSLTYTHSDTANESNASNYSCSERAAAEPLACNETISSRPGTTYFTSRSFRRDRSCERTKHEDSMRLEQDNASSETSSSLIEITTDISEAISETTGIEDTYENGLHCIAAVDVSYLSNLTIRRKKSRFIRSSTDETKDFENTAAESSPSSSDDTTSNECTVVERIPKTAEEMTDDGIDAVLSRKLKLDDGLPCEEAQQSATPSNGREMKALLVESKEECEEPNDVSFESTRISKANMTEDESVTIFLDDTFPNEKTVVENVGHTPTKTTLKHPVTATPAGGKLELDHLSPIRRAEQSSIVSTVKQRHRIAAAKVKQKFTVLDNLSEEDASDTFEDYNDKFESTRINVSRIHRRPTFSQFSFDTTAHQLSRIRSDNSILQAVHLEKGKKWRRSFFAFKNIINHRMSMVAKEDCGRLCNQKFENLISLQSDATIITRELEECSALQTGSDENVAGFEEGDTIAARYGRQEKAKFTSSIHVPTSPNSSLENVDDDTSYGRLSRINEHEIEAGDFVNISSRNSAPLRRSCASTNVAREIVLKHCGQTEPVPFSARFSDRILKNCSKIGEGVYGEVFMLKRGCKKSVIKIIPIEGDQLVNGEKQKTFQEIFSELAITSHLSDLGEKGRRFYTECFAQLKNHHCVYGRYPQRLISLWKEYDLRKGSENDSPTIFKEDQLYIILELDHGGEDIESFVFNNAQQALSVFNQVVNALAVAERAFQFEHRDLHWGNILVSRCMRKKTKFVIENKENYVNLNGVKVTIIDYTLSRITIKKHTLFNDLERDPDLFLAEGDFQFEIYRMMRNAVGNVWNTYAPVTNVYWLRYLLDKMMKEMKYVRSGTILHRKYFAELEHMYHKTLSGDCNSAFQIANSECPYM